MTDSRKLTDNELEQVVGGFAGFTLDDAGGDLNISGFSVGDYVKKSEMTTKTVIGSVSEIVYKIDALDGNNATATMYEKDPAGAVTTTSGQSIILGMYWTKLDPIPGWVPAN